MPEQTQTPLIGPPRRRGWREIMHVRPLTDIPHVALVITRQGRLAGVIPASDRRVLSDYITWPYDFREVDMRERLLLVRGRIDSCDRGYEFEAALKLTYQVERPERVAIELEDALTELEDALVQSMRVTSRSFGVEQAAALEENLREALLYGDVLRERLEALGLGLRRADVVVELDERARGRAEALREHMRERPLLARVAIESLDPTMSFDVLVGGSYRLISRTLTIVPAEAHDSALHEAIARTLRRIGIAFAPHDYQTAARTMADALRHDPLLQAELSSVEIELVRPTVRIQPERHMIIAAQVVSEPAERPRRSVPLLSGPVEDAADAPSWAALGAKFGREAPRALPAPMAPESAAAFVDAELVETPTPGADQPAATSYVEPLDAEGQPHFETQGRPEAPADEAAATVDFEPRLERPSSTPAEDPRGEYPTAPWGALGDTFGRDRPAADHQQAEAQTDMGMPSFVAQAEQPLDNSRIADWLALLQADDPALFKLWSMELVDQPAALPTILSALTSDAALLEASDDMRYQRALAEALAAQSMPPAGAAQQPQAASVATSQHAPEDEPPDWLSLRRLGSEEVPHE